MKAKITSVFLLLNLICMGLFAQIPRVYNKENTGAHFPLPTLPSLSQLPIIQPLTDPFMWSDGSGRSTNFNDWERRRNEIKAEIEHYEIGKKHDKPDNITATYTPNANPLTGVLRVFVTVNGQTLTLTSNVSLPAGSGPFPAVIGMNSLNGSIPADIFTTRNIARITFSHNNVTTYLNPQITDPYYRLYPDQNLSNAGQYSAWAWGVSRLIDGLELVQSSLPVDLTHLGVTGCSYAGKMALFAGALDERIALTIAQESGGGGAPSWRVSHNIEPAGSVEKIDNTDYNWFREDMRQFSGDNVYKLPEDHHELMAMVAPRALLVTGNTDFVWLSNRSCYISARAAKEVYRTLGINDRMGFYIDGGHNHCAVPVSQRPAIEAFVDKFLLEKPGVNTDAITVNPYPELDYLRWYSWWGTGKPPVLPPEPVGLRIWMEAECAATIGSDWQLLSDPLASNGKYVVVNGLQSTAAAPGVTGQIVVPFTIDSAASYNLYARLNCPSANDDSYWIKFDNGAFVTYNGLGTTGWQWLKIATTNLSVGPHTVTIGYREDGAKLDKLLLTTSGAQINGMGTVAPNCSSGVPVITPHQAFDVSETFNNDSTFGSVLATDPDAGTEFQNWLIKGGTGAAAFAIDISTGKLIMKDSSLLDFESATRSYTLILTVSDGFHTSAQETITINLTNANEHTPVVTPGQSFALDGGSCSGLGNVAATDADDTNQPGYTTFQNWQITGGNGAGIFAINPSSGAITIADLNHVDLYNSSYTLIVTVSDGLHTSEPQTVTVTIPDRISVCHKGSLITVSKMAAIAHIKHGDCIGSCGTQPTTRSRFAAEEVTLRAAGIRVYPNPVSDKINIDLGTNSLHIKNIELIDVTGRTVVRMQVKNTLVAIPKGQLRAGNYILQLQGDKILTKQLVIQ